ncbi:MAG: ATP-grasp domain-containing protein [Sulfurimonadaceae bacterium]
MQKTQNPHQKLHAMSQAILITSIGAKIPLIKAVRRAKDAFNPALAIIGGDSNHDALGRAYVDSFWQMPRLENLTLETLITYAQAHNIRAIIPTRDAELPFFASYKKTLAEAGIDVFVADTEAVAFCYDKLRFYQDAKLSWAIETALDIERLPAQKFVVKERFGAGAKSMACNVSKEEALAHAKELQEPIFQPFIEGKEYSIDCYVDKNMACRGVVVRSRDVVVNGESQVTTIVHDRELVQRAAEFVTCHGIKGHSVLQVLKNQNGSYLIECNARFGGASTLSEYAGLKSFLWFLQEANGENFEVTITDKIIRQVRQDKEDSYFES